MFIFLISLINFLNLSKVKAKYEKGKIFVPDSNNFLMIHINDSTGLRLDFDIKQV